MTKPQRPRTLALALAIAAGGVVAPSLMAQPDPREDVLNDERRLRENQEELDRREAEQLEMQRRKMEALVAARSGEAVPSVSDDPLAGLDLDPDERISVNFTDAVQLTSLVNFVSRALGVNIISDDSLQGQSLLFDAPIELSPSELLGFLNAALEVRGYSISRSGSLSKTFLVIPAAQALPRLDGGALATARVVGTMGMRPSALVSSISQILSGNTNTQQLRMTPIDDAGVLILSGPIGTMDSAELLIESIAQQYASRATHRIELTHVSASFARERMIELNGEQVQGAVTSFNRNNQPAATAGGANAPLGNLSTQLRVDTGNALVFSGTDAEFAMVKSLAQSVDVVNPLIAKRYTPGGVLGEVVLAAKRMGLGEVTSADEISASTSRNALNRPQVFQQNAQQTTLQGSVFVVDNQSGSFVYHGTAEQHERVAAMVEEFRRQAIDTGVQTRVFKLLYARATSEGGTGGTLPGSEGGASENAPRGLGVAELLDALLQQPTESQNTGGFLGAGQGGGVGDQADNIAAIVAANSLPTPDGSTGSKLLANSENTLIVADAERNQIIITAPKLVLDQFADIIDQLDRQQAKVQIEVQIVSLTTNDNFDWSSEFQFVAGQFGITNQIGGTLNAPTGGFLDPGTVGTAASGLTTSLIKSQYVPFVINTLKSYGDTRVLSSPQLLVNDNQAARVDSLSEVPFSETTQNANTTTTGQGGTAEAGTVLSVLPRLSNAGEVTLQLSVELSDFTGAAVNGLQPPRQTDEFESVVTIPGNATIMVGGFRLNRRSENETGIPLLMDIPWLGNLFKDVSIEDTQRTIFVFITPRILDDPNDLGLRLAARGPMEEAGIDDGLPTLEPAFMRMTDAKLPTHTELSYMGAQSAERSDLLAEGVR